MTEPDVVPLAPQVRIVFECVDDFIDCDAEKLS